MLGQKQAGPIKPDIAKKVEALLRRGASVTSFTSHRANSYPQRRPCTVLRLHDRAIGHFAAAGLTAPRLR
jgi:hypothetical protein